MDQHGRVNAGTVRVPSPLGRSGDESETCKIPDAAKNPWRPRVYGTDVPSARRLTGARELHNVRRPIPTARHTSAAVLSEWRYSIRACASVSGSVRGRPPGRPRALAAARPAAVRATWSARSIGAMAPMMAQKQRPVAVEVSICSRHETSATPCASKSRTTSSPCASDRDLRRSSVMTMIAPGRPEAISCSPPGRRVVGPLRWSVNGFRPPAWISASSWAASCWPGVLTRA
jgi:hypothetical protein